MKAAVRATGCVTFWDVVLVALAAAWLAVQSVSRANKLGLITTLLGL
jgi:hypothetical protein